MTISIDYRESLKDAKRALQDKREGRTGGGYSEESDETVPMSTRAGSVRSLASNFSAGSMTRSEDDPKWGRDAAARKTFPKHSPLGHGIEEEGESTTYS